MNFQVIDPSDSLWREILHTLRHDFYHLPEYLTLEATRFAAVPEAVLISDREAIFFAPYLLRPCRNISEEEFHLSESFDVVSPNGYAGILLNEAAICKPGFIATAMQKLIHFFQDRRICSAFLRLHPLLNDRFNELYPSEFCEASLETITIDLTLSEVEIWQQTRSSHRNRINKCKRAGFIARRVPFSPYLDEFISIYNETMDRVQASPSAYFYHEYFWRLADILGETLDLWIVEFHNEIASAGLFTECCGIVQYHLGGTRTAFLKYSPIVLLFDDVRWCMKERGNEQMHLGGGVGGSKDSLHHFKAGFSQRKCRLPLLRLITDSKEYDRLVEIRAKSLNVQTEQLLRTGFFQPIDRP
ncbi:MAG: GNAT family N-acetyltransferase [Cyanobacteria bacterium CRU_2_1]|nr:GNAT family N-acetyltransferase [Cyanobacteria bacterium CRU_2_1]